LSDDSDSEDVPEPRETEVNKIWAVWVDLVDSSRFRLVKNPQLQIVQEAHKEEDEKKKEFYLPGKARTTKPVIVQEGDVLYFILGHKSFGTPPSSPPQQSPSPIKYDYLPIPTVKQQNTRKPTIITPAIARVPVSAVAPVPAPVSPAYQPLNSPNLAVTPLTSKQADHTQQMLTLAEMGFTDTELIKNILAYTGGNLGDTVDQIMASLEFA